MSAELAQQQGFTWHDYRNWPDSERWELIAGQAYSMAPAPSIRHQQVSGSLFALLRQRTQGSGCQPFIAPTDVRLSDLDVVQPDVLLVCDPDKITETHIEGAPELVVEVLSPATAIKDLREKKALYQRAGVACYLVIDPLEQYAQLFHLQASGQYDTGRIIGARETLELGLCQGLNIELSEVFDLPQEAGNAGLVP
ncbi:MAG: Uma2 family endonuclease [Gammaproteobacteria bacterium SHHR-1]|uniref:Uma2 family endonuclease n=1 Tax=Magnetovirga frankeli TaxID=947516 RepID=UPI0012930633|nr:Uma2 family endonuclease [gamma proteobacterium SS-5]